MARRRLHAIEVLAGLGNAWILVLAAGALGLAGGILASGRIAAGILALASGMVVVWLAMAWGGLLAFFAQWLFRDRGRGEIIVLVAMVLLLLFSALAPLMEHVKERGGERRTAAGEVTGGKAGASGPPSRPSSREERRPFRGMGIRISREDLSTPLFMKALPPGLYSLSLSLALQGRHAGSAAAGLGLALQAWLLFAVSRRIHATLLDKPSGGRRRRISGRSYEIPALPGLSSRAAAVAQVQVRTALRTVRGKLAVLFAGGFVLVQVAVLRGVPEAGFLARYFLNDGAALAVAASLLALLSLQPFMFNQFASDGDGLALQYLSPVPERDLLLGKAVGLGLLLAMAMVPCTIATLVLAPGTGVEKWLGVPPAVLSIYALVAPLAAYLSMLFPRKADLSKIGSAGNAHGLAGVMGLLGIALAAAPPVILNGLIGTLLGSPWLALGLMAAWAALCVTLSIQLLAGAARLAAGRRENLYLVAGGK